MKGRAPNQRASNCASCGSRIPAGAGTYSDWEGPLHLPGRCSTGTRTYTRTIAAATAAAYREHAWRMFAAAGYCLHPAAGHWPAAITGHGLTAYVGGRRDIRAAGVWSAYEPGFEVFRDGVLVHQAGHPGLDPDGGEALAVLAAGIIAVLDGCRLPPLATAC